MSTQQKTRRKRRIYHIKTAWGLVKTAPLQLHNGNVRNITSPTRHKANLEDAASHISQNEIRMSKSSRGIVWSIAKYG